MQYLIAVQDGLEWVEVGTEDLALGKVVEVGLNSLLGDDALATFYQIAMGGE